MDDIRMSHAVGKKLAAKNPPVTDEEILQCFANRGPSFIDNRPQHETTPPTRFFVADTNKGRRLKVVFIFHLDENYIEIKSAYDANSKDIETYEKLTQQN